MKYHQGARLLQAIFLVIAMISYVDLNAQYTFKQDRFMRNNSTQIIQLEKNGKVQGHAIFLLRGESNKKVKAKYFAEDAYNAFNSWKSGKDIILISSGAYSTGWNSATDTPVGLCVDNGSIVNMNIENDLDGLVIVEAVGGVRVSDIDNKDLYLQSLNRTVSPREDKYLLTNWGKDENATIFQTHLLAYTDGLRINEKKSSKATARRRLFVLGYYDGKLFHAIFHITQDVTLYDATYDAMKTMESLNINVVSILNLDTGGYDILEVYDDYGSQINYLQGTKDKSSATNLLIYYYDPN